MTAFCYFHTGSAICYKHLFLVLGFGKGKKQKDGFCFVLMSCFRAKENNRESTFLKPGHTRLNQQAVGIMRWKDAVQSD